jgi:DNA-binding IclR family transcriptional regulator
MVTSRRIDDALSTLRADYTDTPGLALTPADVAHHCALDRQTAALLLRALERSRFLDRTSDGRFVLARRPGPFES